MSHKRSRAAFESDPPPPLAHAPYAIHGTPLPAYDPDARDDGSYVPVWKQEVTDERGRKRLHGAFTGGFSAGYFNTVGSKEGWTPAAFTSSRTSRGQDGQAKGKEQRVEDFMDEEDLAERAESQQLETHGAFAGLGSTAAGEGGQGMFADLFRASGETMGVKLLQRMGWRQGQGVGPKVKRRAKGDEKGEAHLFAPENSRMVSFGGKHDRKGLGYAGEERLDSRSISGKVDDEADDEDGAGETDARILQTSRLSKPKKILKKAGGFGLGVLNDTGSDEDEGYEMGPKISYNRVIGGDKKKKKGGLLAANNVVTKPVLASTKLTKQSNTLAGFRKCHDGRLPLDGFILTTAPLLAILQENKYPPPTVPEAWEPAGLTIAANPNTPFQSTADAARASTLDPKSRASLLGEQQLPGKSVFSFLTPSTRERLATASGKPNLPPALGEGAPAGFEVDPGEQRRTLWDLVPLLDKATAEAALARASTTGYMPYADDEEKRARYKYFLQLKSGGTSNLPEKAKPFSTEDWIKEMREFVQVAEVFKPMSGLMASRFTSSSSSSATPKLASSHARRETELGKKNEEKEEDPAEKAARLGMYGPLTRSRQPFYPTRLLCKRFNIRMPANVAVDPGVGVDAGTNTSASRLDIVSQASLDRMMIEASSNKGGTALVVSGGGGEGGEEQNSKADSGGRRLVAEVVDVEMNEALEGQRAGEAVFRAIFGGGDEDGSD